MARGAIRKSEREPLSAERIALAALDLIEDESLDGFSTRKLAAKLGCEAMSIYHYFPSRGHLMDALVDRLVGQLTVLSADPADWRSKLEKTGREWRAMGRKHPHFFGFLATARLNTRASLRWLNGVIGLFRSLGLGDEQASRMFRIMGYYINGAVLDETAGYARGASTVEPVPDDELARDFPHVVAAGPWFRETHWDATFELGLRIFLDSIERMIERRLL